MFTMYKKNRFLIPLLAAGSLLVFGFTAGPRSAGQWNSSSTMSADTIPEKSKTEKAFRSSRYNSKTKKVTVMYWDGSKERMSLEEAKKRNLLLPPPKVEMVKFTPPVIKKEQVRKNR